MATLQDVVKEVVQEMGVEEAACDVALSALDEAVSRGVIDADEGILDLAMMQAEQFARKEGCR